VLLLFSRVEIIPLAMQEFRDKTLEERLRIKLKLPMVTVDNSASTRRVTVSVHLITRAKVVGVLDES
jgi:hypothetical protein